MTPLSKRANAGEAPQTNAYARVSLKNLVFNYNSLSAAARGKTIVSVVKANAYGHGASRVTRALMDAGCRHFAVANLAEAEALLRDVPDADVLILGYIPDELIPRAVETGAAVCVYWAPFAAKVALAARQAGKRARVHVKYDTGMNRLGFKGEDDAFSLVSRLIQDPDISLEGLFTHFATSDTDEGVTQSQYARFCALLDRVSAAGISIPLIHCDNSAAIARFDHDRTTAARAGISLYGAPAWEGMGSQVKLKPVMGMFARIANLAVVEAGSPVGYGGTWKAGATRRIATVSAGYADGYLRAFSNRARVFVNGTYAPVVGTVCMDMFMVDVTDAGDVKVGDEVELFGENVPAGELAEMANTISYEIFCLVSGRVARHYV